MKESCISVHIYFDSPSEIDNFLKSELTRFIREVESKYSIRKYFFIRYIDQLGTHIRFRIFNHNIQQTTDLLSSLTYLLNGCLSITPTLSIQSFNSKNLIRSFSYKKYKPELNRYGGKEGVKISELHFRDSSQLVLKILECCENNNNKKFLLTLQTVYCLAFVAGLRGIYLVRYFDILYSHRLNNKNKQSIKTFYTKNRKLLIDSIVMANQYNTIRSFAEKNHSEFYDFIKNCNQTFFSMREVLNKNKKKGSFLTYGSLLFPFFKELKDYNGEETHYYKLLSLLMSYLHMTLNRLGYNKKDEQNIYGVMVHILLDVNQFNEIKFTNNN